jgi:hypothetical protein
LWVGCRTIRRIAFSATADKGKAKQRKYNFDFYMVKQDILSLLLLKRFFEVVEESQVNVVAESTGVIIFGLPLRFPLNQASVVVCNGDEPDGADIIFYIVFGNRRWAVIDTVLKGMVEFAERYQRFMEGIIENTFGPDLISLFIPNRIALGDNIRSPGYVMKVFDFFPDFVGRSVDYRRLVSFSHENYSPLEKSCLAWSGL